MSYNFVLYFVGQIVVSIRWRVSPRNKYLYLLVEMSSDESSFGCINTRDL